MHEENIGKYTLKEILSEIWIADITIDEWVDEAVIRHIPRKKSQHDINFHELLLNFDFCTHHKAYLRIFLGVWRKMPLFNQDIWLGGSMTLNFFIRIGVNGMGIFKGVQDLVNLWDIIPKR